MIHVKILGMWDNIIFRDSEKALEDNSGIFVLVDGDKLKMTHRQWRGLERRTRETFCVMARFIKTQAEQKDVK